jgi:uncharacterized Zn finger protein (UPF0148 family)
MKKTTKKTKVSGNTIKATRSLQSETAADEGNDPDVIDNTGLNEVQLDSIPAADFSSSVAAAESSNQQLPPMFMSTDYSIGMLTSTPTCKNCKQIFISLGSLFCPYCGTPCIDNHVIKNKTTKNYDPANPAAKPWREPPPLINLPSVSNSFFNKKPWKPIMKHGPRRHIQQAKEFKVEQSQAVEESELKGVVEAEASSNPDIVEAVRQGDDANDADTSLDDNGSPSKIVGYFDSFLPIAVYEAEWVILPTSAQHSVHIHLSLLERKRKQEMIECNNTGRKLAHSQYWMRVGVVIDEIEDAPINESFKSYLQRRDAANFLVDTLSTVDFVCNSVGRYLVDRPDAWVDLSAINATEYYMVSICSTNFYVFLQVTLVLLFRLST